MMDDMERKVVRALYEQWKDAKDKAEELKQNMALTVADVVEKINGGSEPENGADGKTKKSKIMKENVTAIFNNRYKHENSGKDKLSSDVLANLEIFGVPIEGVDFNIDEGDMDE